ncbi:fungal hydrophobin-domain-containing protein [Rhodocollybia butyracea]|uniref:Hydrophobin n=1 Tax=Rhodocollybia butyracea TaxID=206335 RepID=A0A9P5PK75_9AGAR|nr:fungal hydrophobin-domain-containing protein [Rhodocollybia butyracea]
MQYKLALVSAALATFALAAPQDATAPATAPAPPAKTCTTGSVQCCQSTQTASEAAADPITKSLLGLVGVTVGDITGLVGLTCSGVNVAGGGTCDAQAVCCKDNSTGGLISVGCAPVTL